LNGTTNCSLDLIPLASVEDVWFQALEDRDNADITQLTQPFTDYVTDQWAEGDRYFLNYYGTEGPRTTNSIEGWRICINNRVDHTSLVSVLECCESAINVQLFLSPWSNGTTNCSLDLCNFNTVLDVFEELKSTGQKKSSVYV
jgi:hypothetical protein